MPLKSSLCQAPAELVHVSLVRVSASDLAERDGELQLGPVKQPEVVGELHVSALPQGALAPRPA